MKNFLSEIKGLYKVGDRVQIRTWESMANQYGVDEKYGYIKCQCLFVKKMQPICGTTATIERIMDDIVLLRFGENEKCNRLFDVFKITKDMIQPTQKTMQRMILYLLKNSPVGRWV